MNTKNDVSTIFSGLNIMLATNDTDKFSRTLFYNHYGTKVSEQYVNALKGLGGSVNVTTIENALERLANSDIAYKPAFVVNICCAFKNLELEGVIPAVAALSHTPCFPCRGDISIIAEEKIISKHLASKAGFTVTETIRKIPYNNPKTLLIRKPINSGDSKGIKVIRVDERVEELNQHEFAEPFVDGPDLELFCIFNAKTNTHILLNACMNNLNSEVGEIQLHSAEMKSSSDNYNPELKDQIIWHTAYVSSQVKEAIERIGELFHHPFIFRIDAKVVRKGHLKTKIQLDEIVFLELNVMPTIPGDSGWFSNKLIALAGVKKDFLMSWQNHLTDDQIALRLLFIIWYKHYVQSKSVEGNIPVRSTNSPI